MKIQEVYQKALKFAGEKHSNQKVPGSEANYLLHISNVCMEILVAYSENKDFDVELAVQVAALHDVIEDTETCFEEVTRLFGKSVACGVLALSKDKTIEDKRESMLDSLSRIKSQPREVGMVKLADRITNLQKPPHYWNTEKIKKYKAEAQTILTALKGRNQYLESRLEKKIEQYQAYES
jgi:(p)ppGpp synthase/HD superfamily hydrolase